MAKTSDAMLKAINKYNKEKTDEFKIRLPKGNKEIIQNYCREKEITVTGLITELLTERLAADGYKLITKSDKTE